MDDSLTIGRLAQRFGLAPSAIRFYERTGVLPEPDRVGGQRRYGPEAVRRLEVLEAAKRAGFSLGEAALLVRDADAGAPPAATLRTLAQRKLPEVEATIARAERTRAWMHAASGCSCASLDVCGLFAPG